MNILDKLSTISKNEKDLETFIEEHLTEIYAFFLSQSSSDLKPFREQIKTYLDSNLRIFKKLDFSNSSVSNFILILLEISERFAFLSTFSRLFKLLQKNNCEIGHRLKASSLFLMNIKSINDYENRVDEILDYLNLAQSEEDSSEPIFNTLVNFYAQLVNNFGVQNEAGVVAIKNILLSKSQNINYLFLKNPFFLKVLNFKIDGNSSYAKIQEELDEFLNRTKKYIPFLKEIFLIEENTNYSSLIKGTIPSFYNFRQIAVNHYNQIANADGVFYSLNRGVEILTKEDQMFIYLRSYGNMHYEKLMSAFTYLPNKAFDNEIQILDWGCGQGIATTTLLEYLAIKHITPNIKSIDLIEPSELALKRAALHVKRFNPKFTIRTINKDLDSLENKDLVNNHTSTKIHLLSNILDIDSISLPKFLALLKAKFTGENYFICVSPLISNLKTSRLNSFVAFFDDTPLFQEFASIDNKRGEWKKKWSRVIRIFKTGI